MSAKGLMARILYIEDDGPSRSVMYLILSRSNYEFIAAISGASGVEMAIAHQPDLILLDYNLPDMNGGKVMARLREHPETQHIPVIILSASAYDHDTSHFTEMGVDAYIPKPVNRFVLLRTIERVLKNDEA